MSPKPVRFYPKGSKPVQCEGAEAVAYTYESETAFYAVMYVGKAQRPTWHYRFRTEKARAEKIAETFAAAVRHKTWRAERSAERKAYVHDVKVGDVFHASWGYDQTNNNYYECVEVQGKYIVVREICSRYEETGFMSGNSTPSPGHYRTDFEPKRCLVGHGKSIKINSVITASYMAPDKDNKYQSHYESSYA